MSTVAAEASKPASADRHAQPGAGTPGQMASWRTLWKALLVPHAGDQTGDDAIEQDHKKRPVTVP